MSEPWDPRYTPEDARIVKRVVRRMTGQNARLASEAEDYEQEIAMHVAIRSHRFNCALAPRKRFVSTIAKNKMLNLIEAQRAQKRDSRRTVSLEGAGDGVLIDGRVSPAKIDTQLDVRHAIERLPEDLRQVALLRLDHSERELESLLGKTRSQVRSRIKRIERLLRQSGLSPAADNSTAIERPEPVHKGGHNTKPKEPAR